MKTPICERPKSTNDKIEKITNPFILKPDSTVIMHSPIPGVEVLHPAPYPLLHRADDVIHAVHGVEAAALGGGGVEGELLAALGEAGRAPTCMMKIVRLYFCLLFQD